MAQPRGINQLEHGRVANAVRTVQSRRIQNSFDFGKGEDIRQLETAFGQIDQTGRIKVENFLLQQEFMKPPNGDKVPCSGSGGNSIIS
jgi:hypothetical protein